MERYSRQQIKTKMETRAATTVTRTAMLHGTPVLKMPHLVLSPVSSSVCLTMLLRTTLPVRKNLSGRGSPSVSPNSPLIINTIERNYLLTWRKVPHQGPLDITFSSDGGTAYISFHGSVDEVDPKGYLVGSVAFDSVTGQPTRAYDSYIALDDIIQNADDNNCPSCMRPVGLALLGDRVLFSSDATGEIYVLVQSSTSSSGHDKTVHVAIGVSVAFACVVMVLGGMIYWRWRRSRQLLGVHTSVPRSGSMSFGGLSGRDENKSAGIQLTQRRSPGRSSGARNPFQDRLQRQTREQNSVQGS